MTEELKEKYLERINALRYIDDDFMTVCLADNIKAVELILRIVLNRDDITVKSVRTQVQLKNLQGRSVGLDILAIDKEQNEINIEIQRASSGAGAKRAAYHSSLLVSHMLEPQGDVESMPESYVIFITENDVLKGGQSLYPVERMVKIKDEYVLFGDGTHILYVNGEYRGDDAVGKLMYDFFCNNPDDMNYEELAKKARYFKREEEGVNTMCKIFEEIKEEGRVEGKEEGREEGLLEGAKKNQKEIATRMIKENMSLGDISRLTALPINVLEELKKQFAQPI